jgi:hypothetical protein
MPTKPSQEKPKSFVLFPRLYRFDAEVGVTDAGKSAGRGSEKWLSNSGTSRKTYDLMGQFDVQCSNVPTRDGAPTVSDQYRGNPRALWE